MPAPKVKIIDETFRVSLGQHLLSGFVHKFRPLWVQLGNLESRALHDQLQNVEIDRPIYIAGLARSGSTILLEAAAAHPQVVTHQYRDFPFLFTPYARRQSQQGTLQNKTAPTERAHGDGLLVTPESPEAMEEVLWMAFFRDAHNPQASQVMDRQADHPAFERFYRDHIRKLLLVSGKGRYASKGNYNLVRLPYLHQRFPDAKIVIPVRRPQSHIASLMKQHRLFTQGQSQRPRARQHMRRVGHYEFGLDRRPINPGDDQTTREVAELWEQGEEVRGWARYWASIYGWVADRLAGDDGLRQATEVVRFEDLCDCPETTLDRVVAHCQLQDPGRLSQFATRVRAPTYYRPQFDSGEEEIIREETQAVAERFGYEEDYSGENRGLAPSG